MEDQDPPISGSYIRTLVKQMKPKGPINPNGQNSCTGAARNPSRNQKTPPLQHKKQVRRRLHTTRPYQERLLNMAEARREIVTALKFHRAAMRKAAGEQQQPPETLPAELPARSCPKPRKIPKTPQPSSSAVNTIPNFYSPNGFFYPSFPIAPLAANENLDIALPEQTLGLNLNFHDFQNLDAVSLFQNAGVSNSSSSSSPATDQQAPAGGGGLHVAVGEEEMEEIRSIGEKHEMEWSDKMSMVTSARWFRFMKPSPEIGKRPEEEEEEEGYGIQNPMDQVMEFPEWLSNGNEGNLQQQLFSDYCSDDYFLHDPALPRMDIGEFEGMDGEWLA